MAVVVLLWKNMRKLSLEQLRTHFMNTAVEYFFVSILTLKNVPSTHNFFLAINAADESKVVVFVVVCVNNFRQLFMFNFWYTWCSSVVQKTGEVKTITFFLLWSFLPSHHSGTSDNKHKLQKSFACPQYFFEESGSHTNVGKLGLGSSGEPSFNIRHVYMCGHFSCIF